MNEDFKIYCFKTKETKKALEELSRKGLRHISVAPAPSGEESLIYGSFNEPPPTLSLQHASASSPSFLYQQQWAMFAPHFDGKYSRIDLSEYGAPSSSSFLMEPGAGFGDLSHPTTELCLKALCSIQSCYSHVIDIGAGSGILSIAAAFLGHSKITAIECDEMSLMHAHNNFKLNELNNITLQKELPFSLEPQTLVMMNMTLKEQTPIIEWLQSIGRPPLTLITSGILNTQRDHYLDILAKEPHRIEEEEKWAGFIFQQF